MRTRMAAWIVLLVLFALVISNDGAAGTGAAATSAASGPKTSSKVNPGSSGPPGTTPASKPKGSGSAKFESCVVLVSTASIIMLQLLR